MTRWRSLSPAAGRLERPKITLVLIGLSVVSGAAAESLRLGPMTHWDGGGAEVAMIETDGPVIVGTIRDGGLMIIDMTPAEGDDARPFVEVFGCVGVG